MSTGYKVSVTSERKITMASAKNKEFLIINRRSGKALQAGGLDNGLAVTQAEITKSDAQIWTMEKTTEGAKLINKAASKVLDVMTGGTENGTWAQTWEDVGGTSQFWTVTGTTYKKLLNNASGRVLDIADMSDENGANAQLWDDVGGENQQWKFASLEAKTTVTKKAPAKAPAKTSAKASTKTATKAAAKATAKATSKTADKKPAAKKAGKAADKKPGDSAKKASEK